MFATLDPASRSIKIRSIRRRRGANRLRGNMPILEVLEDRVVLSNTDVWTGLGGTNLWQNAGNW